MTDATDLTEKGRAIRLGILGEAHAKRAANSRTDFNADFQDFLLKYSWAEIWGRPGLDARTRSMITIGMLVGMGKLDELKLHIRATANTGVSRDEIKEIMMHATIYAGVPAAYGAFQVAVQVLAEMDAEVSKA
ncbi:MAG: 4-carboxymuconolactone decarboxylase [Hyphomicrobiales bacterium]|nr:MAG: 4-carboxymuconolactone decarboxylase [Hyphomicrobiales bacterium]